MHYYKIPTQSLHFCDMPKERNILLNRVPLKTFMEEFSE